MQWGNWGSHETKARKGSPALSEAMSPIVAAAPDPPTPLLVRDWVEVMKKRSIGSCLYGYSSTLRWALVVYEYCSKCVENVLWKYISNPESWYCTYAKNSPLIPFLCHCQNFNLRAKDGVLQQPSKTLCLADAEKKRRKHIDSFQKKKKRYKSYIIASCQSQGIKKKITYSYFACTPVQRLLEFCCLGGMILIDWFSPAAVRLLLSSLMLLEHQQLLHL